MAAVEAWFLGGPVDGRMMLVETTAAGILPAVVRMPQAGLYVGASECAMPVVAHLYAQSERWDDVQVYSYQGIDEASR
ncbi:hypothetical protein [Verrucosispora sp. WMMC514]|uniref:hypothetical protein n=1 Tax=Verrucosispora sp. WMMC514 TaxID=3015156 RepID=UPI00248B1432|nr:hypothetical protein [Verrucosispora sp. WMMC514]WBB93355.1 hypothetical protein O7597_10455 [Verrucosispora sp. WMMC514]